MKFIFSILLIALLAFAFGLFMPWWSIAIAAFMVPLFIQQSNMLSFFSGLLGVFILWLLLSWFISSSNDHILATRMSHILPVGSVTVLILLTAFVGGLLGGLSALSGSLLRKLF